MDIEYPYKIYIQKNLSITETTLIFDGKKDIFENLSNYEITSDDSQFDLLAYNLQNLDFILLIQIDDENKKFRKSMSDCLDKCILLQSEDYCKNDFFYQRNEVCFYAFLLWLNNLLNYLRKIKCLRKNIVLENLAKIKNFL